MAGHALVDDVEWQEGLQLRALLDAVVEAEAERRQLAGEELLRAGGRALANVELQQLLLRVDLVQKGGVRRLGVRGGHGAAATAKLGEGCKVVIIFTPIFQLTRHQDPILGARCSLDDR